MAKLIYGAITSLDGYIEDAEGKFDWAEPDEEVHAFVNDLERPIGTYLYGRRMYETMVFWERPPDLADQPSFVRDFAEIWQAAEKIVYSKTLQTASSERTRNRERVRSGSGAAAEGDSVAGHNRRWSRACGKGDRGWSGRRVSPLSRASRGGRRQAVSSRQQRPCESRAAGRTPVPQRHGLSPLPNPGVMPATA